MPVHAAAKIVRAKPARPVAKARLVTKATRKPDMKAYTLPKDDVDALVAYLASLKK